jgi:hypothetical protein
MGEWSTDRLDPATRVPAARDQQEQLAWERRTRRTPKARRREDNEGEQDDPPEQSPEQSEDVPNHQIDNLA